MSLACSLIERSHGSCQSGTREEEGARRAPPCPAAAGGCAGVPPAPRRPAQARCAGRPHGAGAASCGCGRRPRWRRPRPRGVIIVGVRSGPGGGTQTAELVGASGLPHKVARAPLLPAVPGGNVQVAIAVPFRDQLPIQDRRAQLARFVPHMLAFLSSIPNCQSVVVIVEQSADGHKFNRGQLLNIGFRLAEEALPGLTSFVMHDVDLLPSMDMRPAYANPPPEGHAVHLASRWPKYTYATFIGGVLAFAPKDFLRVNGYPNNYWGWGLEDDQLSLRMSHCGVRTLRPPIGSYVDLDPVNMKTILESRQREEVKKHLPWYNSEMFRKQGLSLDSDWSQNGLRNLDYKLVRRTTSENGCVMHSIVELGSAPEQQGSGVQLQQQR